MEKILEESMMYVGRLAPSPTGALHLGNVRTFMIAWLRARKAEGKVVLRTEDLDHPRDKPGAIEQTMKELRWLGFDWDEEYVQSERKDIYRSAIEYLHTNGCAYPCICSRHDVETAQSAPHAGEQLHYPGKCRGRFSTWGMAVKAANGRMPCWRFNVAENVHVSFDDAFVGHYEQDVALTLGDFPLARDEDGAGYTLACVVDDILMHITEVVRGDDLLPATPAQILVARALSPWIQHSFNQSTISLPSYCHVPLVVGRDGRRLAKRHGDTRIATYRASGISPEEIIGRLAYRSGIIGTYRKVALSELIKIFDLRSVDARPLFLV